MVVNLRSFIGNLLSIPSIASRGSQAPVTLQISYLDDPFEYRVHASMYIRSTTDDQENQRSAPPRDGRGLFYTAMLPVQERFPPGTSGNPAGISKLRREFESKFFEALVDPELAEEALGALRCAIKEGQSWALQTYFSRVLPPQPLDVRMEVNRRADEIDWSRVSDDELEKLERSPSALLDQASLKAERARRSLLRFVGALKQDYKADAFHLELCGIVEKFPCGRGSAAPAACHRLRATTTRKIRDRQPEVSRLGAGEESRPAHHRRELQRRLGRIAGLGRAAHHRLARVSRHLSRDAHRWAIRAEGRSQARGGLL